MIAAELQRSIWPWYRHKIQNGLQGTELLTVTLCFQICICAATTGGAGCCTKNVRLPEQFLMMVEASDAPRVLVRVVATKKMAISKKKFPPRPGF